MAEETKNITISKTNTGFPDYLDFEKLRSEGIDYLGKLSGKIWTDYNVHDPGITILEVLCYALLDLGYRTALPETDIFTASPDNSAGQSFFTPSHILACNPLNITDFRKLLIDIEGIKNAWLEVATQNAEFLNGLYHVYIDLEKDIQKEFEKDESAKKLYLDELIHKVKTALMAHRNLCEDFIDIVILCKQEMGVCADIELEESANAETVYLNVVKSLHDFFSPSPMFYTLQQLLDKQKPIEDIFAGRPYNITESHGFIDTEELEKLKLRKEIHLSDVYHAIFNVEGVKNVSDLRLQNCKDNVVNAVKGWKYTLPENHIPEFSLACSGFQFSRNGSALFVDTKKFEGLFAINFTHNGKIKYHAPSPYLDLEVPKGAYRNDLADYYSIQNEFPRVYGIAEGGLPENISSARKARAYQLKAWLLFFDQFLANYLAQLKHIPSLFALSSPDNEEGHTYFVQQLTHVPDHQKLVRFGLNQDANNVLGTQGSILVFPVDKNKLTELIAQDKIKTTSIEDIPPFTFKTLSEQDIAINQLKNDLYFEQYDCQYITKNEECVFYYILTSSDEIALISKKYFKSIEEAKEHATSVKYIGTFDENYRSFLTSGDVFSFDIELNLSSFTKYLQLIVEDKELFYQRRQGFLDHLMARFAEQFTDLALLSFVKDQPSPLLEIKTKENFLSHYDDLSSNRGKGYNYLENGWNNNNLSGFEKKIKALTGIKNEKRQSLCNFTVTKYDNQYTVVLKIASTSFFATKESYDSKEEALQVAEALFHAMKEKKNYQTEYIPHEKQYGLKIIYDTDRKAVFPSTYATEKEAINTINRLSGLFAEKDPAQQVFISAYLYTPELKDASGNRIYSSLISYSNEEVSKKEVLKTIKKISDPRQWKPEENVSLPGKLFHNNYDKVRLAFIDTQAFKIDINNTIIGKPDSFTYDLLDKENTFNFRSTNIFANSNQARKNANNLLGLLADEERYQIFRDTDKFLIRIRKGENIQAICTIESNTFEDATKLKNLILSIVKKHQYFIEIKEKPDRWRFNYLLGYQQNNLYRFESDEEFSNSEDAAKAATLLLDNEDRLQLQNGKEELKLTVKGKKGIPSLHLIEEKKEESIPKRKEAVSKLLAEKKEILRLKNTQDITDFDPSVEPDEISREGLYVYRLIDKDHVPAFYTKKFESEDEAKAEIKNMYELFSRASGHLQLCMGGTHIIHKRKDAKNNSYWYHYRLTSLNYFYTSGKPLVLFESTKGYPTPEEAEKSFRENYLQILHLAADAGNYGNAISFKEIIIHDKDPGTKSPAIVFIPEATLEDSGNWNDKVIHKLTTLALSYPIQTVALNSNEFYKLFPCEKKDPKQDNSCKKEETYVYYFTLRAGSEDQWQSIHFYTSPEEAWKEFDFFKLLLHCPGNYYTDCGHCINNDQPGYRIYIREVLAESTERFLNEERAWGKDGVQKFICTAQSNDPFHPYRRKNDCCYSFYVACRDSLIYHPCRYDTPQKRDKVMIDLYQALKNATQTRSWQINDSENNLLLLDESGQPFAAIERRRGNYNYCNSDLIALLENNSDNKDNYKEEEGRIILVNNNNEILAYSIKENIALSEWKTSLQTFLCYYPIVKTPSQNNEEAKYCIEIKLPGFSTCKEDRAEEKPCGCGNEKVKNDHDCYIAWKSKCCFDTCDAAEQALQTILKLLQNYEFYQPVFDCVCASYGISLHSEKSRVIADENITYYVEEANIAQWHSSEIVAINPQCYPNKETACEAVARTKELINRKGLHLVEHILLRPRCFPEDRKCPQYSNYCDNNMGCEFIWKEGDNDPCEEEKDLHFVPGTDPFSFIATAVLPAWPDQLRKKEYREALEKIIYREAPAHVLLRILWLTPHDLCSFENKFKNWNQWLALKKTCTNESPVCDFLGFLFDRNYECLDDCTVCEACDETKEQRQPCFAVTKRKQNENKYLNQINEIFCWTIQNCDRQERPQILSRQSSKRINARLSKYKNQMEAVAEKRKDDPLVAKVTRFLNDPQPSFNRLSRLVNEILQNKPAKKDSKPLSDPQVFDALKNSICYWLDRTITNEKDSKEIQEAKKLFKKLNDAKIRTEQIYSYWNFSELKKYQPSLNEKEAKAIFMLKNK